MLMLLVAVGLFGSSGVYLYNNVWTDPNRLLSDMLEKSIETPSVQRVITQESQQSTVNQTLYLSFSPNLVAQSSTKLEQAARVGEETAVTTETIGTRTQDFVRYSAISVPATQKNKDFSSVVGQWGKREKNDEKNIPATFLNEALFSVIPFGDLTKEQRTQLLAQIKDSKPYTYDKAEKKIQNHRPVMVYNMNIKTENLVRVLAKYVELTGSGDASQLDPTQYKNAPPLNVTFTIDILSRHLKQINFADSGRIEDYSAYGLRRMVEIPTQTITIDELQTRLQKLQ